jgi:hypothetical protein
MTSREPLRQIVESTVAIDGLRRRDRRRVAVFLGAGASATFGYPITGQLLERVAISLDRRSTNFLKDLRGDPRGTGHRNRELLAEYLTALLPGPTLQRENLPLVTTLLSLLDYSLVAGQSMLPSQSAARTRDARRLLERGILEAIDDTRDFDEGSLEQLRIFCSFLTAMRRRCSNGPLPIITTNYDLTADETAFMCARIPGRRYWDEDVIARRVDFGFPWLHPDSSSVRVYPRPSRPAFQVLKLHGSTNWLRCPLCDNVYVNPWGPIWHQAYKTKPDRNSTCHCSDTQLEAQIVSPSFVRDVRAANLLSVWKTALDCLRAAAEWVIVGYSFPDEDLAIRALFTRAYSSRRRRPHITVIQKGDSSYARFAAFFERSRLNFCTGGLQDFLGAWRRALTRSQQQRLIEKWRRPRRKAWRG